MTRGSGGSGTRLRLGPRVAARKLARAARPGGAPTPGRGAGRGPSMAVLPGAGRTRWGRVRTVAARGRLFHHPSCHEASFWGEIQGTDEDQACQRGSASPVAPTPNMVVGVCPSHFNAETSNLIRSPRPLWGKGGKGFFLRSNLPAGRSISSAPFLPVLQEERSVMLPRNQKNEYFLRALISGYWGKLRFIKATWHGVKRLER